MINRKEEALILTYDVASIPNGANLDKVFEIFQNNQILFYDSSKGNEPKVITAKKDLENTIKFINTIDKTFQELSTDFTLIDKIQNEYLFTTKNRLIS